MSDEKTEKAEVTVRVKIPREKIELPPCPKCSWVAFAIVVVLVLLNIVVRVAISCNRAGISLNIGPMIESWTLMSAIVMCLGSAFILLLLYFVYCRHVLGIARENRKAEKDRMDFISRQVDALKNLAVAPDKRQRTETIKVIIEHLAKSGDGRAGAAGEGPKGSNGDGDGYQADVPSNPLSAVAYLQGY